MLEVVPPDVSRHSAWLESHREWGPGPHEDGFGLDPTDDVDSPEGFAVWVSRLRSLPAGRTWWIVDGDEVLGGIALRTAAGPVVGRLGHVGYGIRPSARGRGLATWALGELLPHARAAGLGRLLLVCLDDNVGSIRTIERNGGSSSRSSTRSTAGCGATGSTFDESHATRPVARARVLRMALWSGPWTATTTARRRWCVPTTSSWSWSGRTWRSSRP